MQAGRGADEQAQRLAVRLERDRGAPGADPQKIAALQARQRAWAVGAEGERATAAHLAELEAEDGWCVLHDVRWPGRPKANLDHVAVGPGGVVVIDSKNWSEPARAGKGTLWRGRYPARQEAEDLLRMVAAVSALLPAEQRRHVSSVLCVVQQDLAPTVLDGGVVAVGGVHLAGWLRGLPPVVAPGDVGGLARSLAALLEGRAGRTLASTADLERSPAPPRAGASGRGRPAPSAPRRPAGTRSPRSRSVGGRPSPSRPPSPARAAAPSGRGRSRRRVDRWALVKLAALGVAFLTAPAWAEVAQAGLTQLLLDQLFVPPAEVATAP